MKESKIKKVIDTLEIIVDSREKLPNHVTDCFDQYGVKWIKKKLKSGDYSARIPINEELGILEEINLEEILVIERKMSLDELSQNLTKHMDRFEKEFSRTSAKVIIIIENDNYKKLAKGQYSSQIHPKGFLGLLHTFADKHDAQFFFVDKNYSALYIYNTFKYRVKNILKNI